MTNMSSGNSTDLGYGVSALQPAQTTETTGDPLAAGHLCIASAVAGQ
jgi:hypothetical protein